MSNKHAVMSMYVEIGMPAPFTGNNPEVPGKIQRNNYY